jgi:predicted CXXCH cytochrome family protein
MKRFALAVACLGFLCLATAVLQPRASAAQDEPTYVGTQVCAGCHKAVYTEWLLTTHRRTLAEGREPEKTGCEACHGPGSAHVAGGGDKSKINNPRKMSAKGSSDICLKCHKQQEVVLYRTSLHASSKVSCTNCHDVHMPGKATMLADIDAKQNSVEGLTHEIQDAKQEANIASNDADRQKAADKVKALEAKKTELKASLDQVQTRARRQSEPELCYACHKEQQAQFKMPTHHPIPESRMDCSGCHNPHGGPKKNLREETVNETCYKCHAAMEGPFVFEHPPVSEDCTICHKPHGSAQNYLLKQAEPFLCLKCHAGPHSRSRTFANGDDLTKSSRVPSYYWQCTSCHTRPHGSDLHAAFHY